MRPEPNDPEYLPADERTALVEFLDYYRCVLARKAEGLTSAQLAHTTAASNLTLGGLIKHMALVEDHWFTSRLMGLPEPEPWASAPFDEDPDWELNSAAGDGPQYLLDLYDEACDRSRAIITAAPSLELVSVEGGNGQRGPWNLRWILVHMIEEYARHVGHADLLREEVDGSVGD